MKCVVAPYNFIVSQSIASNFTSANQNVLEHDVIAIQLNYTGSPTGTFTINGSVDGVNFVALYVSVNGNSTLAASIAISSVASPIIVTFANPGIAYLQVSYTAGSGSSTLNGWITKKRIGD